MDVTLSTFIACCKRFCRIRWSLLLQSGRKAVLVSIPPDRQPLSICLEWSEYPRTDPWWNERGLIDRFNANRLKHVASSSWRVVDESMSPYRPHMTKTGTLDHLSFVQRKPEPLGTEFKNVACSRTGIMLHLEIQEGMARMATKQFCDTLSNTAACTLRLAKATKGCGQDPVERVVEGIYADSWFGNMTTLEALMDNGFEAVLSIEMGHECMPKKEVENIMKPWPGGSNLVLTCTTPRLCLSVTRAARKRRCSSFIRRMLVQQSRQISIT